MPLAKAIPMFSPHVAPGCAERAADVMRSPLIGQGQLVDDFEAAIRGALDLPHVVAVNASSSAIRLALSIIGVGPGDEVVTTPMTCTITNHPILEQFATPVFADIQADTGNIDPADVERRITARTKAIVCAHWAGTPCDLDELQAVGRAHAIPIVEDASEAFGAMYRGRSVGRQSRFAAFSFQAVQIITTAEGGALAMQAAADEHQARVQRWYGIDRVGRKPNMLGYYDFDVTAVGFGYHMTNLAAAIGLENLATLPAQRAHRRAIAEIYWEGLTGVAGLGLVRRCDDREPAYHFFTVLAERRDNFSRKLGAAGIRVSIVHARNDEYSIFGGLRGDLPQLDVFSRAYVGLPIHMGMTVDDAAYIVATIRSGW